MSDNLSFEEVESNRKKWIDFLREDGRKKAAQILDQGNEHRCCLGHACYVLGVPRSAVGSVIYYGAALVKATAPDELVKMLGLRGPVGELAEPTKVDKHILNQKQYTVRDLASLNDFTDYTPMMIADFIEEQYDNVFLSEEEYKERYGVANV